MKEVINTGVDKYDLLKRARNNKKPARGDIVVSHLSRQRIGRFKSDKEKDEFKIVQFTDLINLIGVR